MNKIEFLNELENALAGRLQESDIKEITSDYGDIFDNSVANGKSEEEVAKEIGSPAKIARTILEDGMDPNKQKTSYSSEGNGGGFSYNSNGERTYTDFQKNINEKTSKIFDKVIEPDKNVELEQLTPMSRRLGAYVIDSILLGVVTIGLAFVFLVPLVFLRFTNVGVDSVPVQHMAQMGGAMVGNNIVSGLAFGNIIIFGLIFGAFNLFTVIFIWATNGYTPGKWLLKMRVVKINGAKISFLEAFLREVIIKCIANSMLSGFLNIISFIWGCLTDDHKTVQDLAAQTRVIEWQRDKGKSAKASNPLES